IGLRGFTNERGDFLITTLPVAPLAAQLSDTLPHFADGGGWTTQVILTNASDGTESGTIQFFGQGSATQSAPLLDMTVSGLFGSSFGYTIPPHASVRLVTAGTNPTTQVGSVRMTPSNS